MANVKTEHKEKVKVSIAQILGWLEQGIDRKQIAVKLGLPYAQVALLFKSTPELKGRKVKNTEPIKRFELVPEGQESPILDSGSTSTSEVPVAEPAATEGTGWN